MVTRDEDRTTRVVRWIARISSAVSAGLILVIFVGEGLTEGSGALLHLTPREAAMMAAFFALWLGLVLSWKWELYGGLLTVLGLVAFYLFDYLLSGEIPRGPFFLVFASPSLLFLYYGLRNRGESEVEGSQ